jgi:hypothetical protein
VRTDAAVEGGGEGARGGGEAIARHGQHQPELQRHVLGSDAAVEGGGERTQGGGQAVARCRRRMVG